MKLMSSNSPNLPKQKIFTTWAMHPCNLLNHVSVTEHLWSSVNDMGNLIWKKIFQNRIHCNGMLMVVFSNSTWLKVGSELQSKTERTWIDRHWKSIEYINIQLLAVTGRLRWYVFSLAQWSDSTTFFVRLSKGLWLHFYPFLDVLRCADAICRLVTPILVDWLLLLGDRFTSKVYISITVGYLFA